MSSLQRLTPPFMPGWETVSRQALSSIAMLLHQLNLLSHVELRGGYLWTFSEDLGDFPEPEARTFFQGLMSNRRQLSDKEWASIFEVRVVHLVWCTLCQALPSAATQVCGSNAGHLITTSGYLKTHDDVQAGACLVLDAWPCESCFNLLTRHPSVSQRSARSGAAPRARWRQG